MEGETVALIDFLYADLSVISAIANTSEPETDQDALIILRHIGELSQSSIGALDDYLNLPVSK